MMTRFVVSTAATFKEESADWKYVSSFCGRQEEARIHIKKAVMDSALHGLLLMDANIFFKPMQRHNLASLKIN